MEGDKGEGEQEIRKSPRIYHGKILAEEKCSFFTNVSEQFVTSVYRRGGAFFIIFKLTPTYTRI